jgi:hypothetical protein
VPAQGQQRPVHPVVRRHLHVARLGLAAAAGHPQQIHRPQRIELRQDEAALELAAGIVHRPPAVRTPKKAGRLAWPANA